jgi:hypothetical protein
MQSQRRNHCIITQDGNTLENYHSYRVKQSAKYKQRIKSCNNKLANLHFWQQKEQ